MADSNITKRALAMSLKELLETIPFDKISVSQICEKCDMNRKSFYYHFKDKYDLVNWIYDTEFISLACETNYDNGLDFLADLSCYLDKNREFYKHALRIKGQNSFSDHFAEVLEPILIENLSSTFGEELDRFHILFFSDAIVGVIKRWILEMDNVSAEEFLKIIFSILQKTSEKVFLETHTIEK